MKTMPLPQYLLVVFCLISVLFSYDYMQTERYVTFFVNDKAAVVSGNRNTITSKYLIYTSKGVFENTDSFLYTKFNSSDVYNRLSNGQAYQCKVVGYRLPFLSVYPNIISVSRIDSSSVAP